MDVKFLPRNIGEKFPNLKIFVTESSALTIVRNFYLKNMQNLEFLNLDNNKITKIESEAFSDLVKVHQLWLHDNLIETLDENIFATMVNLKNIDLHNNKINFLSPTTFRIPGGKFDYLDLSSNVCINRFYGSGSSNLEHELRIKCSFWL